ncbi:MAG: hypothetical protein OHK006_10090 [Thermodesulfovibrionales bacterium]
MATLSIVLAIFLWSSLGVVVRLSGVSVPVFIFYSVLVALIPQAAVVSRMRYRTQFRNTGRLKFLLLFGVFGLLNSLSFFSAFQKTTVANAVLTHYTAPVIVALLAPVFLKEEITRVVIAAIALASAGLVVMLNGFTIDPGHLIGMLAGLLSGFSYAAIIILGRILAQEFSPVVLSFAVNSVVVLALAPFVGIPPVRAVWAFLVTGIVHSTIAPILYYHGLQQVSANRTAVLGYLEPVCAILISAIVLRELPGLHSLFGGVLIIISGYLAILGSEV